MTISCVQVPNALMASSFSRLLSLKNSLSSSPRIFSCGYKGVLSNSSATRNWVTVRDKGHRIENHLLVHDSLHSHNDQVVDFPTRSQEGDFSGTPNVPVYVMLPVVMSFHECGGNVGDDVHIPIPQWVTEIGQSNADIYFTNREGICNTECLTWGIDVERVLRGRTAVEVYFDFMRSFRVEFDEFFEDGIISEIEIGLGPCGELRYPSYPAKHGWKYPGIGEFQCYDRYLMKNLKKAAETKGYSFWGRGPDNAGSYNSQPHETRFFCDGGDYDSYYGRFFLSWYSKVLIDHGDRVLALANLTFGGTSIAAKLSGIHWWYKTVSHAAELTAGFYNPANKDGYAPISSMLKKYEAALNFTCVELRTMDQHEDFPEALADPEGLVWQVLNAAWDVNIPVASENALPCHDREGYNKILENAKPRNDPHGRHLSAFTYLRLSPVLMETHNFTEFEQFVKRMHGEVVTDCYHHSSEEASNYSQ